MTSPNEIKPVTLCIPSEYNIPIINANNCSFLFLGLGCTTVVYPESAALAAAQIIALSDHTVWAKLRVQQVNTHNKLTLADQKIRSS